MRTSTPIIGGVQEKISQSSCPNSLLFPTNVETPHRNPEQLIKKSIVTFQDFQNVETSEKSKTF